MSHSWSNAQSFEGIAYTCGYCGNRVGAASGYARLASNDRVLICDVCGQPTYRRGSDEFIPGASYGEPVASLPTEIDQLYNEARGCMAVPAYNAAVLLSRKILMHVAVEVGADPGKKFIEYVEYLADENFVPPNAKGWVDHIRDKGNEANHEIVLMSRAEAEGLLSFIEMLLKLVYEFPSKVPSSPAPNGGV